MANKLVYGVQLVVVDSNGYQTECIVIISAITGPVLHVFYVRGILLMVLWFQEQVN